MTFKILSLDGGGIRGVISERIIQEIEQQIQKLKGQSLNEYFDLISGTSTGALTTAALAVGMNTNQIMNIYKHETQEIFPYRSRLCPERLPLIAKCGISAPKFSNEGLINVIKRYLIKNNIPIKMKDVVKPYILMVAYNMSTEEPTFFVNKDCQDSLWYSDIPLWEICVCSASAPTYFPPYELKDKGESYAYVDGGVAANNPTLAAVSHAIKLGYKLEEISVISIGTGKNTKTYKFTEIVDWGLADWAIPLFSVILNAQGKTDNLLSEQILGFYNTSIYLRLQFNLNKISNSFDDARPENIRKLIEAAESFLDYDKVNYIKINNQPNHISVKSAIAKFITNY